MENIQENAPECPPAPSFESVWDLLQETGRLIKESAQEIDKRFKETDKKFKEIYECSNKTKRLMRQNQKMMDDLGKKFDTIIEHMFIPNLTEKFNAFGFVFEKSGTNVLIGSREQNIYAEIDVFLENGDSALAVEVKTQANISDVREHVERMEKLRRHFDSRDDRRKLYGAVAAAIFQSNVAAFALEQGFYIIEQSGDTVKVKKPEGEAKAW